MTAQNMNPKIKLAALVKDFRYWLSKNYSIEDIDNACYDDTGYPRWKEVESYFSELLEKKLIKDLDKEDQINLLFLIARNWDCCSMIAYISSGKQLSNLGNLEKRDFLALARTLSELDHIEFDDAKSQFVSIITKFDFISDDVKDLLLIFFHDKCEYTKRLAMLTLAKFGYEKTEDLVKYCWQNIDDEHNKMACLYIIDEYLNNNILLQHYLLLAENEEGSYLREAAKEIKMKRNYI